MASATFPAASFRNPAEISKLSLPPVAPNPVKPSIFRDPTVASAASVVSVTVIELAVIVGIPKSVVANV